MTVINQRKNLKVINKYWQSKNMNAVINSLQRMNDHSLVVDVLRETFAEGYGINELDPNKNENLNFLLGSARKLIESKYEQHAIIGLKTTTNIVHHFAKVKSPSPKRAEALFIALTFSLREQYMAIIK